MISAESLQAFYRAPGETPEVAAGPGVRYVVVACMDPRLHPEQSLGLSVGDAYVIRNAGGRVSGDTLRSLMVALSTQGAQEVVVIHHTDCALVRNTNQQLQAAVRGAAGVDVSNVDFLAYTDLAGSVRDDVRAISSAPQLPNDVAVVGFACDTDSGQLQLVVGSPRSQLPQAQAGAGEAAPTPARSGAPSSPPVPAPASADTVPAEPASSWETPTPPPVARPGEGGQPPVFGPHRTRRALPWIGTAVVIVAVLAAIGALTGHHSSSSSPATSTTTAKPAPTTPPTTATPSTTVSSALATAPVYQQPLATASSDFAPFNQDGASGTYTDGGYRVTVGPGTSELVYPDTITKVTGQASAPTVDVGVTASSTTTGDGFYGVDCRITSSGDDAYFLDITDQGLATIGDSSSQFASLSSPSPAINQGGQPNVIRGICSGDPGQPVRLTLIVNGVTVLSATHSSSSLTPGGTVGIDVNNLSGNGSGTGSPASVLFSNFAVRVPAPGGSAAPASG